MTRQSRGWNHRSTLPPRRHPNPGRTETFRRLNRTEYQNTIRDLLALDVDVASLLPPDESSHGFDNITVTDLSPTLLNRYLSAAQKISRLAVGTSARERPAAILFAFVPMSRRTPTSRACRSARAAASLIPYNFPQDGEYEIQVRLMRDRNEGIESLQRDSRAGSAAGPGAGASFSPSSRRRRETAIKPSMRI